MKLTNLRVRGYRALMRPFSDWSRTKRMRSYVNLMDIKEGMSILDLGGQPMIWESVTPCVNLTILNTPGTAIRNHILSHNVSFIEGDACAVEGVADLSFDNVFSNSVIEHVGSAEKRAGFAKEARRLGRSYWIQTPAKWFPIEAHCGMPFWWFYPAKLRQYFIRRWRKRLPAWALMVEETTVLTKSELHFLFPEATVRTERILGVPKSYIAYFHGSNCKAAVYDAQKQNLVQSRRTAYGWA
jgi:hypothetical protein